MKSAPVGSLLAYVSQVPDPRGRQGLRHPLSAMLATVVCAVLCGARGYAAMVQWLHLQPVSTWHRLGFTRRPPKDTCFETLLSRVSAEAVEGALSRWIQEGLNLSLDEELRAVSIDGKTLRGTLSAHQKAVHLLAALDQKLGCVFSQIPVDEKTNEAKAALKLLDWLVLEGRVIVGDAMFCQHEVCETIRDRGGHYFFVVKDNQPTLLREIQAAFVDTRAFSPLRPAGIS
ncbi:MAG: ISAs1 family transposase [Ramlibacter sp.]|nr:ISAs1 family transposase [Ramlibacter sp.]